MFGSSPLLVMLDGPVLALSDIMHGIAPGPATAAPSQDDPDPEKIPGAESSTPEPLDNAQIELMRKRVLELIVSGASKINTSSSEKELLEMVIRLTSAHIPDVTQLCTQAKTIQELCRQRDFIIKEVEEERARWEAERLGFDRVAEALIARRSHGGESTYREEELERQVAMLDADNKALRQKLSEYHLRVQSVEAELAQLRPVLLMQPYALTHSFPPSHNHYLHSSAHKVDITKRVKRRKQGDADQDATEEEPDNTAIASGTPRARPRGDYYRRRDTDQFGDNPRHRRRAQKKSSAALADARAEHVLLAARKVGRERASILAGLAPAAGRDRDKDLKNDTDQIDATPKTPRKHQTVRVGNGSSTGVIYLNSPIPATADTASVEQVSSDLSPAQTPLTFRKSARNQLTQGRAARVNPLTPLDSLLTAASTISMIDDEDEDGDGDSAEPDSAPLASSKPSMRQIPATSFGSPAPTKRRRLASSKPARSLAHAVTAPDGKDASERLRRGRSALDVLADQAAVFSSQDHDSASTKDKGKGKTKAPDPSRPNASSDAAAPTVDEPARQNSRSRDQGLQQRPQVAPHQLQSSSAPSAPTQPATITARDHDPPPPTTPETERLSPPPMNVPPPTTASPSAHMPSTDTSQGTLTTPPKDGEILLADPSRTYDCAETQAT
ncbi:hypothetical protein BJV74DRAFT_984147 [Russula compacta]|nr:hypothetical protein BJV74DRAFT_984147 [Russula compacta]